MKKKLLILTALFVLALVLVSCGSSNPYEGLNLEEYITPGAFPGIEYDADELQSKIDEEIEYTFSEQKVLEEVDRAATLQDTVDLTFKAVCEDKEVEELSKESVSIDLTVEDENYNFLKDVLEGKSKGDEFTASRTLPEDYENGELAGKDVTYTGTVLKVSELVIPELTDELIAENGNLTVDTKDEYLKLLNDYYLNNMLWENLLESTEVIKYPEERLKELYDNAVTNLRLSAASSGLSDEEYVKNGVPMNYGNGYNYNVTYDSVEEYLTYALRSIKSSVKNEMLTYYLADKYDIECSDSSLSDESDILSNLQEQLLKLAQENAVPTTAGPEETTSEPETTAPETTAETAAAETKAEETAAETAA